MCLIDKGKGKQRLTELIEEIIFDKETEIKFLVYYISWYIFSFNCEYLVMNIVDFRTTLKVERKHDGVKVVNTVKTDYDEEYDYLLEF